MPKPPPATVYPVEGFFILGVPSLAAAYPADVAAELVATGAFTYEPPDVPAEEPSTPADAGPEPED